MKGLAVRYLVSRRGRGDCWRHYWQPSGCLRKAGWETTRLSDDFEKAVEEAQERNRAVDMWRTSGGETIKSRRAEQSLSDAGIYIIQAGTGPIKIGISRDPERRRRSLQVGNGMETTLHFFLRLPDGVAGQVEAKVHRVLANSRLSGEWFNVAPQHAVDAVIQQLESFYRTP